MSAGLVASIVLAMAFCGAAIAAVSYFSDPIIGAVFAYWCGTINMALLEALAAERRA